MKTRRVFYSPLSMIFRILETWRYSHVCQFVSFFCLFVFCHLVYEEISLMNLQSADVYFSQTLKIYDTLLNSRFQISLEYKKSGVSEVWYKMISSAHLLKEHRRFLWISLKPSKDVGYMTCETAATSLETKSFAGSTHLLSLTCCINPLQLFYSTSFYASCYCYCCG